jgi:hypothetical protein
MQEANVENQILPASVYAWQQLFQLNMQLYKPEVTDWLHSDEAAPVLANILVNVPCSRTLH